MFEPTPEQAAILSAAQSATDNLIIEARAGAAKTTTLVMLAEALAPLEIRCVAFNKKIADELNQRLPQNAQAATMNSLGHRAWGRFLGRRLKLEKSKTYSLLSDEVRRLRDEDQEAARESFSFILQAVRQSKSSGFITKHPHAKPLISREDFFLGLEEEPTPLEEELILAVIKKSLDQALQGIIDFDDQLLCSALFPVSFEPAPLTLVDEAQDLSVIQHLMLRKMCRGKRLIAVGDPFQAIYGFRGADEDSMQSLASMFDMKTHYLTLTFRCPSEIVAEAQWRAPDMTSAAKHSGEVQTWAAWNADMIPDNAAILCRNNAPLFRMALNLIRAGRYPELLGNDVLAGMIKLLRSFGDMTMSQSSAMERAAAWRDSKEKKVRGKAALEDRYQCLLLLLEQGPVLGDAIAYAESLAKSKGRIKLMTVHKSKGLEFDTVFILDQQLMRPKGQDLNLRYVAQTRAQRQLIYITTDGYETAPGG